MAAAKPVPAAPPAAPIHARHLEAVRNGNDDYTATEYLLEGDGKTWRTVSSRVIVAHASRNVTTDYVREWWRERAGLDYDGDFS